MNIEDLIKKSNYLFRNIRDYGEQMVVDVVSDNPQQCPSLKEYSKLLLGNGLYYAGLAGMKIARRE